MSTHWFESGSHALTREAQWMSKRVLSVRLGVQVSSRVPLELLFTGYLTNFVSLCRKAIRWRFFVRVTCRSTLTIRHFKECGGERPPFGYQFPAQYYPRPGRVK